MNLQELNDLNSGANSHDGKAGRIENLANRLAELRKSDQPLMVAYKSMGNWDGEIRSVIEGIINEHGSDLLRIVEMRFAASARQERASAKMKREQISDFLSSSEVA